MDLEDGVRFGSLCLNAAGGSRCPVASDVLETLDAAAAATEAPAASPLCLFTSLTEAYVEGHVVFAKAALRHAPALRQRSIPMHILDQSLSESGRARVSAAYSPTIWIHRQASTAKDVGSVTKFALNKEKVVLFGLREQCGAVLKIDTGDMLPLDGFGSLLDHPALRDTSARFQSARQYGRSRRSDSPTERSTVV